MSALRGMLAGSLSLIALQAVVGTASSSKRLGGLATDIASIIDRSVSPAVPLIPDRRSSSSTSSSSYTAGSGLAALPPTQFSTAPLPRPATPAPVIAPASPVYPA